ncbi:MAG: T9SS type A sorting domain-containing protein, partial [Ignavibacteria bacterium]|nr:T9SS type A sorting domain-containing protein [Ignavibacteria bacterium]
WVGTNTSIFKIDTFKVHLGPVGIKKISSVVEGYSLEQNYPNPFNPSTKINFSLPVRENVTLKVYDILGNEVASLLNSDRLEAGSYTYDFDTKTYNLSSGVYYYVIRTDKYVASKKMILMK